MFYFNDQLVKNIEPLYPRVNTAEVDTIKKEISYAQAIKEVFHGEYCTDLKFPKIIGLVRIERPIDYIHHLGHRKLLKQKN